ncbi:hypothetical protein [Magnetospirillum sp. SS-4]|uniref:hypothetical protein n=1 Tax=Magnetospirillum sp. SS-4 TaxID=2681465 RepID=UPI00137C4237|nr:hypothetical protein [Magnetospirillum sp. SS-4]CAA7616384.1 exported hypothetical protein [Magnetospirillum sp. SS-4]
MRWGLLVAAWLALSPSPARADIDDSAYQAGEAIRDEERLRRLRGDIEAEREQERRRAIEAAAEAGRIHAEAQAREAARPYPERLTGQACTQCHAAENYTANRHTWLVWRLVVARMVWLNEADIPPDAQALIASHLAASHPASPGEAFVEYGVPVASVLIVAGLIWGGRKHVAAKRRRSARTGTRGM